MTTKQIQERSAEDKAAAKPISVPAGSFKLSDLEKIGEKAAGAKPEERQSVVDAALVEANLNPAKHQDPALEPGHKYAAVRHEELGITETIQVRDVKGEKPVDPDKEAAALAKEQEAAAAAAEKEAEARNKANAQAAAAGNQGDAGGDAGSK